MSNRFRWRSSTLIYAHTLRSTERNEMSMGSPGDNPVTDLLSHRINHFPSDISQMIRRLHKIDPLIANKITNGDDRTIWDGEKNEEKNRTILYELLEEKGIDTEYYKSEAKVLNENQPRK